MHRDSLNETHTTHALGWRGRASAREAEYCDTSCVKAMRTVVSAAAHRRQVISTGRHRRFIERVLAQPQLVRAIADNASLPTGYGRGYSERCIEWPWALARLSPGSVLDAGGTLNHAFVLRTIPQSVVHICVMSVSPEPALDDHRVRYARADLRRIPMTDASFDTVACLSTLEHVGMDISGYAEGIAASGDPQAEALTVIDELWRVLRPGGRLLVSCPVGAPQRFGSARHLSRQDVAEVLARAPGPSTTHLYAHSTAGWHPSTWGAVAELRYRERRVEPIARDRAPAARAVVCLEVRRP